ncbi:hypothetical protein L1887_40507 [Cichorium endivia]|nr:hypothetical protein L1887_40507 [Cichorium endivia]
MSPTTGSFVAPRGELSSASIRSRRELGRVRGQTRLASAQSRGAESADKRHVRRTYRCLVQQAHSCCSLFRQSSTRPTPARNQSVESMPGISEAKGMSSPKSAASADVGSKNWSFFNSASSSGTPIARAPSIKAGTSSGTSSGADPPANPDSVEASAPFHLSSSRTPTSATSLGHGMGPRVTSADLSSRIRLPSRLPTLQPRRRPPALRLLHPSHIGSLLRATATCLPAPYPHRLRRVDPVNRRSVVLAPLRRRSARARRSLQPQFDVSAVPFGHLGCTERHAGWPTAQCAMGRRQPSARAESKSSALGRRPQRPIVDGFRRASTRRAEALERGRRGRRCLDRLGPRHDANACPTFQPCTVITLGAILGTEFVGAVRIGCQRQPQHRARGSIERSQPEDASARAVRIGDGSRHPTRASRTRTAVAIRDRRIARRGGRRRSHRALPNRKDAPVLVPSAGWPWAA